MIANVGLPPLVAETVEIVVSRSESIADAADGAATVPAADAPSAGAPGLPLGLGGGGGLLGGGSGLLGLVGGLSSPLAR